MSKVKEFFVDERFCKNGYLGFNYGKEEVMYLKYDFGSKENPCLTFKFFHRKEDCDKFIYAYPALATGNDLDGAYQTSQIAGFEVLLEIPLESDLETLKFFQRDCPKSFWIYKESFLCDDEMEGLCSHEIIVPYDDLKDKNRIYIGYFEK